MSSVDDFMAQLAAQTMPSGKQREFKEKKRIIEKISLNFEGNFGRFQILPMDNVVTDYPFVVLKNTREVCIPRKITAADGTETVYNAWIHLIPKDAYKMRDMTGRTVSSLTAEEEQLLSEANTVFDQLFEESGAKDNVEILRTLVRKRNYTLFHGYCLNKWSFDSNNRAPERSNFSGLFVCTASGFAQAVSDNVNERTLLNGGDRSFLKSIYGRSTTGRNGFIMVSISRKRDGNGKGYTVSVQHEVTPAVAGAIIPEEDSKLMSDPLANWLGWQAKREEENEPAESRRLFNAPLIKSAIEFMTQQLAAIRMAKQAGTSLEEAIAKTNEVALANLKPAETPKTNDPMLNDMYKNDDTNNVTAERVTNGNTNPFATPAAAHFDPITGAPVSGGSNVNESSPTVSSMPFTQPNFSSFGTGTDNAMPF